MVSLIVAVLLLGLVHCSMAQDQHFYHNLAFIVPPVVVFILTIIFIIIGVWMIYKARKGQFLCCKPVSRIRADPKSDIESKAYKEEGLPLYNMKPRDVKAPPAYNDALNDKLADQDEDAIDDRAPLNP